MGELYRRLSLDGGRTIVISDVHGNLACLRGLLDKLALAPSDRLILLGDLVERGPESLATLRYALSLRSRCRLLGVLGNWDLWHLWADGTDPKWDEWVRGYLLRRKNTPCRGLVLEMCREAGIELAPDFSMPALKAALRERFAPEFDYLRSLPCLLESEDFVFVHGGLPEGTPPEKADPWQCVKLDGFYASRPHFPKWVVAGHTPVCLYGSDTISAVPIVDKECRVASIDGGCVLKDDGQLNALILENGAIRWDWYDPFPLVRALDRQAPGARSYYIRWGDNRVELLARGEEFCRVRHRRTGYEMDVPTDFLFYRDGALLTTDVTDYRPAVEPGDVLSLVRATSRGAWIKKNGVSGWYEGTLEPLP